MCERSDYFKAAIEDHFGETSVTENEGLPLVTLHSVTADIFEQVLNYIYSDTCEVGSVWFEYTQLCFAISETLLNFKNINYNRWDFCYM